MISSMTGFGKGSAANEHIMAEAEIKSVNSRYLEISLKLPKTLQNKEYEVRESIRSKIKRGKLIVNLQIKRNGFEDNKPVLNKENLDYALYFLKQVKKAARIKDKLTLDNILTFQDLFLSDIVEESEEEFSLISEALTAALNDLMVMRKKEGEELSKDIRNRVENINNLVKKIEDINKGCVNEFFEKTKERAKQLFNDINLYNERLELELALLVDKSDVTEECVRLNSHIKFFLENLESGEEIGRKLNFLCQEINREANTIGSKSLSTEISHSTVSIKEELEKIREQIQNLE